MSKEKYTPSGLPLISQERIEVYFRDLDKRIYEGEISLRGFMEEMGDKIFEDNAGLEYFFEEISKRENEPNSQFMIGFTGGAIFMYDLLKSQLEIIAMEENQR